MRALTRTMYCITIAVALVVTTAVASAGPKARATRTGSTDSYGQYQLDWSPSADMSGAKPLAGSTVDASPIWVRMTVTTAPKVGVSVVEWYANGSLVRDNDVDAPYDLKQEGQAFPDGSSSVKAVVRFADGATKQVTASFTTATSSTSTTVPAADYGSYQLEWSGSADMAGAAPLSGATTNVNTVWVRLDTLSSPSVGISVVHWYANGVLVRDNDVDAPYDLAAKGYTFPDGTATAKAVVKFTDGASTSVQANFTTKTTSSTTTTTKPSSLPFAGPGTVGHLADLPGFNTPATNLTLYQGDFSSSRDGQVIEAMHITGRLYIRHQNVTVRRNRIGLGVFALPTSTTPVSARVEWNTIGPEYGHEASTKSNYLPGNGRGENIVFYRNEMFGAIDLFNFYNTRGNVRIEENWVYGAYQMLSDPYQQDGWSTVSHSDGIQVHWGGAGYHIVRNRIDLFLFRGYYWAGEPNNSAQVQYSPRASAKSSLGKSPNIAPMTTGFLMQQTNGRLDDIVFDGNHIDGDYYRLWSFPKNSYTQSATNVRITNNTIVRRFPNFGRDQLIGVDTPGNVVFAGNTDDKGTAIPTPAGMRTS